MTMSSYNIKKLNSKLDSLIKTLNGGEGSGNFGHTGRLGKVGGSGAGNWSHNPSEKDPQNEFDRVDEYCLPKKTADKLSELKQVNTYSKIEKFLSDRGISIDTDVKDLKGKYKDEVIDSPSKTFVRLAIGIEAYRDKFGNDALSSLKKVKLYDNDESSKAAYYFSELGEKEPKEGQISFRQWDNTGREIFHELAHAYQDSHKRNGEDAVTYSNRVVKEAKLSDKATAYTGAGASGNGKGIEAERFADSFARGFSYGNKEDLGFIDRVAKLESKKKNSITLNGGEGSGNFRHGGRPGQVGGSSSTGGSGTKSDKALFESVKQMADIFSSMNKREGYKYSSSEDLVLKQGKFFTPETRPADVKLGAKKECFSNAARLALERSNLTYVEGYAMINDSLPLPIAHAWCVDKKGRVVDNTWEKPGVAYFGVPFKTSYLAKKLSETGVYGILSGSVGSSDFLKDGVPSDWIASVKKQKNSLVTNGGKGSGNFGHLGRIGEVGGSSKAGFKLSKEDVERVKGLSQSEMDAEISTKVMEVVSKSRMEIGKVLDGAVQSEELRKAYGKPENTPLATEKQLKKIEEINRKARQENEEIKREYYKAKDRWIEPGYYKRKNGDIVEVVEEWSSPEWDYKGDKFQEYYSIEASKADRYSKNYIDDFTIERLKKGESLEKTNLTREEIIKNVGNYLEEGRTFGGVSRQEERAFSIYSYATPENQDLRKGVSINDIPSAKRIKDCIDRTVAVTGTFYRGFRDSLGASSVSGLKIGDTYVDKGFMSTSWDSDVAKKKFGDSGVTMEIRNNKKKGGINFSMSGYSRSPEESEVLFNAGTPMKVVDIQKIGDRTHYVMEII